MAFELVKDQTVQKQTKTCLLQTLQGQEIQNKVHHKKAWFVLENTWLCPNLYRGGKNASSCLILRIHEDAELWPCANKTKCFSSTCHERYPLETQNTSKQHGYIWLHGYFSIKILAVSSQAVLRDQGKPMPEQRVHCTEARHLMGKHWTPQ